MHVFPGTGFTNKHTMFGFIMHVFPGIGCTNKQKIELQLLEIFNVKNHH